MCKLGLQQVYNKLQLDFSLSFSRPQEMCVGWPPLPLEAARATAGKRRRGEEDEEEQGEKEDK